MHKRLVKIINPINMIQLFPSLLWAVGHCWHGFGFCTLISYGLLYKNAVNKKLRGKNLLFNQYIFFCLAHLWIEGWVYQLTILGWISLSLYLSLWPVCWYWLVCKMDSFNEVFHAFFAVILWVGFEWWRGTFCFDGYMFNFAALSMILNFPLLYQSADLFGVWLPSFILLSIVGLHSFNSLRWCKLVISFLLISFIFIYGYFKTNNSIDIKNDLKVRVLQTDLEMGLKQSLTPSEQLRNFNNWLLISNNWKKEDKPDLIVWPETMLPGVGFDQLTCDQIDLLGNGWSYLTLPQKIIKESATENNMSYLVGTITWSGIEYFKNNTDMIRSVKKYNSSSLIKPNSDPVVYHKKALTPFGEKLPFIDNFVFLTRIFKKFVPNGLDFQLDQGSSKELFSIRSGNKKMRFCTPICFEGTVPKLVRELVYQEGEKKADLIINISNDGWFGRNNREQVSWIEKIHANSGRIRHLIASIARTIENRIPMIRAVNSGPTLLINSNGYLSKEVKYEGSLFKDNIDLSRLKGTICMEASPKFDDRKSYYSYLGDSLGMLYGFLSLFFLILNVYKILN